MRGATRRTMRDAIRSQKVLSETLCSPSRVVERLCGRRGNELFEQPRREERSCRSLGWGTARGEGEVVVRSAMVLDDKKVFPERDQTDESLRTERNKTDRALADRQAAVEDDADMVVQRARENADAVLSTAREKADQQLERASDEPPSPEIVEERVLEDEVLRDERATADESLRRERSENARALSKLLPLEREKTDRYLLTERARSDDALANRDDFLGIVSHDLRNLLCGIVMSASQLSTIATDNDDGEKYFWDAHPTLRRTDEPPHWRPGRCRQHRRRQARRHGSPR